MLALFRCIVSKLRRQHVWTHGYTVMEQPVARDLFQSLAAGIMLVERQQSSDNSLCSYPVASNTSQPGITCHKLQKRQALAPSSKPNFEPKNEAIFGFTYWNNRSGLSETETKNSFRQKRHKLSKANRNAAAPKKRYPNECARQPFYRCSHNRGVCLA